MTTTHLTKMNRQELAAEYEKCIGYNPFEDDPSLTDDDVRQTLTEWREELRLALLATRCKECQGYGYTYSSPFNPSEKAQRMTCPCCDGEGFVS
jgi:hypothetical protein